jgi:hypothetical protein
MLHDVPYSPHWLLHAQSQQHHVATATTTGVIEAGSHTLSPFYIHIERRLEHFYGVSTTLTATTMLHDVTYRQHWFLHAQSQQHHVAAAKTTGVIEAGSHTISPFYIHIVRRFEHVYGVSTTCLLVIPLPGVLESPHCCCMACPNNSVYMNNE